jgi:hypothetical protein
MALPKTIKPIATTPAISTISIWIAMVINPLDLLLSAKHIGTESADRHPRAMCAASSWTNLGQMIL